MGTIYQRKKHRLRYSLIRLFFHIPLFYPQIYFELLYYDVFLFLIFDQQYNNLKQQFSFNFPNFRQHWLQKTLMAMA